MSLMRTLSFRHGVPGAMRAMMVLLAVGLISGCGGGDGTTDPGETPAFTISLSGSNLTIVQGANGSVTVTVTRSGGFTGAVAVSVEGLPAGVTAGALNIASGSTSGSLQLTAAAGATVGGAQLTVRGTGSGVDPKTASLALTVNASTPAPTPDFTLSLNPTSGSAAQGATAQTTVTIARTGGFAGAVTLSASGLPAGVTAGFNPAAPAGTTSAVTFTVGGAAPVGTYPVTIQGTGTGVANRSVSYSLQVTAVAPPVGGNTSWAFCAVSGLPGWFAVKNGNGAWTRVTGTNGVYTFQIDNTGGIAWVWEGSGGQNLHVIFATQAELNTAGGERCINPGAGKTVNGSVPGLGVFDMVAMTLGGAFPAATPTWQAPNASFQNVPTGSVDLIAGRSLITPAPLAVTPQRYFIQRGLNPAEGSTLPATDLFGGDSFAPSEHLLTILGATGSQILTLVSLRTAGGSFGNLSSSLGNPNWYAIPGARLQAGDIQLLSVTSSTPAALAPSQTTLKMIGNPGPQTITVGPALTVPTVIPLTATGYARARAEYPIQTQYNRHWMANFQQALPNLRAATVEMSRGFRGSATGTVSLEIPDFTGVAGWNADWGLKTGNQVTWTVSGIGGWEGTGLSAPTWTDGNTFGTASHQGQFTPP